MNTKSYSMKSRDAFASLASKAVEILYRKNKKNYGISSIINVESDKKYQKKDIDLVVHLKTTGDKALKTVYVEIKGDTYPSGDISPILGETDKGNFFFEVISNDSKDPRTPGCFMYTESDIVYYLYLTTGTLYQLKTNEVREWFKEYSGYNDDWLNHSISMDELLKTNSRLKKTSTVTDSETKIMYNTWGITIPIKTVLTELGKKGIKVKKKDMLLEVIEAAASSGIIKQLLDKMPQDVKNRANDLWLKHHPDLPALTTLNQKINITPSTLEM